jgi:hypothetical protein
MEGAYRKAEPVRTVIQPVCHNSWTRKEMIVDDRNPFGEVVGP